MKPTYQHFVEHTRLANNFLLSQRRHLSYDELEVKASEFLSIIFPDGLEETHKETFFGILKNLAYNSGKLKKVS